MTDNNDKITLKHCTSIFGGILLLIVSGTQGWAIKQVIQNGKDVAVLQKNEFSMENRVSLQRELGEIKAAIQVISAKMDRD